ncbi:hypothetical protein RJ639_047658 [Escallonia herrerae]|uniref:DDHD domain-containing protein n=1 Tax=Escallonia herrerae TaxID=1293975 RepID=A0AA88W6X7_9ASTE|nr:hypothetical protein RJ639_047658 [Escallonia herrerae]
MVAVSLEYGLMNGRDDDNTGGVDCWRFWDANCGVSNQLNRLYLKFLQRNPGYDGKVSLYGHSLGSVLSYDILCHQETLSSPFPMDWMYKEHTNNEKSSPNIGNQSSRCNSTSDLGNKNFSVNNEIEGMVGPIDEGNVGAAEEHAEDSCIPLGPPALSDSDHSAIAVDYDASSLDEGIVEPTYDSHGLNESSSLESGSKQNDEEVSQSDNDRTVKLLREEIEFLNARIKELEAQSGAKGTEQESTAVTTQPVSERLPSGQYDASKSYTPYINYTKLAFKVDTFFAAGSPLGVFLALRNIRIGIGALTNTFSNVSPYHPLVMPLGPRCYSLFCDAAMLAHIYGIAISVSRSMDLSRNDLFSIKPNKTGCSLDLATPMDGTTETKERKNGDHGV